MITKCTFNGNSALSSGGAIYGSASSMLLYGCDFVKNSGKNGGAIYPDGGTLTLNKCNFQQNSAIAGGGAMRGKSATQDITECIFSGNTARAVSTNASWSGALYNEGCTQNLTKCLFVGNMALAEEEMSALGGAVYNLESTQTVTNCTFSGNTGADFGGAVYNHRSKQNVVNSTFCSIRAKYYGAAMYNDRTTPIVVNSIFWNNETKDTEVSKCIIPATTLTMQNCVADYDYGGKNNIVKNPELIALDKNLQPTSVSADIYIYRPADNSPARAAGHSVGTHTIAAEKITVPSYDQTGRMRPSEGYIDIGSYQSEKTESTGGCSSGIPAIPALVILTALFISRKK